ncbi:carboxymuconolactone decarboxylase family protein [Bauldia litoralis]|uniref:carboxymuconolactone decarboxylase family protein n=1 Tax=Bauldia litoralis TaxID=665467 RepID=UPI003264A781
MATLPFDPDKLAPADRAIYDRLKAHRAAVGAPLTGPYLALMNHPQLAEKIEALGYFLKFDGALPRSVYQVVVLTVARTCRAAFEWIDHVDHAREAGVPDEVIEAIRAGRTADLAEPFATALPVIEAALAWTDVPEPAQERAIARFGMKGFVELVVLSGFYQMFSGINEGFAVNPPSGTEPPF